MGACRQGCVDCEFFGGYAGQNGDLDRGSKGPACAVAHSAARMAVGQPFGCDYLDADTVYFA